MADNFNMKQFLAENKLGAYSKLKEENVEEAKNVSKEDKIQVVKEWIWFTCDEGHAKDDINKYNKMVDIYFADKDDVTKEDFKKIWAKVSEKYGVGDTGADSEAFPETWRDVQKGKLVDPSMTYEGEAAYEYEKGKAAGKKEEKEKLQKEDLDQDRTDAESEKMMDFLYEKDKTEEAVGLKSVQKAEMFIQNILKNIATNSNIPTDEKEGLINALGKLQEFIDEVGYDSEMEMGEKEQSGSINEEQDYLPPSATERMDGLVLQSALKALMAGAQAIIRDFKEEGYEDEEIYDYIVSKIKTLG